MQKEQKKGKAWCHVDMDGLSAIYAYHGKKTPTERDEFYLSAVQNSLSFFKKNGIKATYFVIAQDLDDPIKKEAVQRVIKDGHSIASHGYAHRKLSALSRTEKEQEIVASKKKIEQTLNVECLGYRAPGFDIDYESLALLAEAGYRYDTSLFPKYRTKEKLGLERILPEPFKLFPDKDFFEIPMPSVGVLPAFHPCYSFYLSRLYYKACLKSFQKNCRYYTLLFHLTDFADKQKLRQGFKLNIFTNNFFSRGHKLRFLDSLIKTTRKYFDFVVTEDFIRQWPNSAPDLNPNTILGISTTHETGACLVRDGKILSAINEERLSRLKMDSIYPPVRSIREVIRIANIDPKSIDAVAISGLRWPDLLPQTWDGFVQDIKDSHGLRDYIFHFARILYRLFYFWRAMGYGRVMDFLEKEYGIKPKAFYVEHHECHAASAFRTGTEDRGLIVTSDGVGDDLSLTVSEGNGSTIQRIAKFFYPHSFGQFYTACTQVLGFKGGRHEGKITGLAGYGKPNPEVLSAVDRTLFADKKGFRLNKNYYAEGFIRGIKLRKILKGQIGFHSLEYRNYKMPLKKLLQGYSREDVAYAFQHILEREMINVIKRHWQGHSNLYLAGGVFANVKLNMAVSQAIQPKQIYVFPNMGDGGLCVGAALSVKGEKPNAVSSMYLGTNFSEKEILETLERNDMVAYQKPDSVALSVAQALHDKKIVARFDGAMEFGPRALGNRSMLYHCADRSVNDWLNQQLNRTEFMPFAPMCMYEDAEEYFLIREGEKRACEFMTLVVQCTDKMKTTCPAAVHVDGTARPQLVRKDINPEMHEILRKYKELTGISCIINTSFNMHEEPIVRSPQEAIDAFTQSKVDMLILGPYIVQEKLAKEIKAA